MVYTFVHNYNPLCKDNTVRIIQEVLNHYTNLYKINFIYNKDSQPMIKFAQIDYHEEEPHAMCSPSLPALLILNTKFIDHSIDSEIQSVILHELGHFLGLNHPTFFNSLNLQTVMSYDKNELPISSTGETIYPTTLMPYDILALSKLYPLNITGKDAYFDIDGNKPKLHCLVGSGGKDTIDVSSYKGNADIDLHPPILNKVGDNYFYIGPVMTNINKVIGAQGHNNIRTADGDHIIDLRASLESNTVELTGKGHDHCYFNSNVSNQTLILYGGQGEKHIQGFSLEKGIIKYANSTEELTTCISDKEREGLIRDHCLHLPEADIYFEDYIHETEIAGLTPSLNIEALS
jgi:hypothetical protein